MGTEPSRSHYTILGVGPRATSKEIRVAYLNLARALHPDRVRSGSPAEQQLAAANTDLQTLRANAQAAEQAEVLKLAGELATNGGLTVDDLKLLPVARLRELKAKAAPVLTGNAGGGGGDPYATYPDNPGFEPKEGK